MTLTYRVIRDAACLVFKIIGRTRVIGHKNIPWDGPVVVACNHVSFADPPLVGSNIRRECAFMARHDLWKSRLLGGLISRLNAFPVHRDTPDRGALRAAVDVLKRGLVLILFPEGTRSMDGALQEASGGIALIVQRSGAPVVPCVVVGPETMWPPGSKRLRFTRLMVVFGRPIFFTPDSPRDEVVGAIMGAIATLLLQYRPHLPPGPVYPPRDV
jgi:1-acyl-sn-glycerol-3-phosphate acyltransferase